MDAGRALCRGPPRDTPMANKMLIDATHPEETRVVVLRGNRVEEFDFESASRRQLRGNIYLAKVTRVEPSLQAAFIDYGGNRHGFLAFSEIHPDYYQIPVADRQALIAEEERAHRDAEAEADRRASMRRRPPQRQAAERRSEMVASEPLSDELIDPDLEVTEGETREVSPDIQAEAAESAESVTGERREDERADATADGGRAGAPVEALAQDEQNLPKLETMELSGHEAASGRDVEHDGRLPQSGETAMHPGHDAVDETAGADLQAAEEAHEEEDGNGQGELAEGDDEEIVESVGGDDAMEEVPDRAPRPRRQYKIQEVIKRRQIMLVQVVKEERGTKGAALTTYLSLAGRYSVLMPNTARGGGISRKITNVMDRRRLKEIAQELEVPEGMGIILRTAGATRTKTEIKRDFEYLLRAWETVRDLTLKSTAPTLVYEEGSLIKRAIRDLYTKDIDEVVVAGDAAYREARDFMRMLMPSHTKNVRPYHDSQPIFAKYGIESQLDAMFSPVVQLRSGGYIVLNQTEALVAIDVNSGRATREHHIEDTALKTNLEASEEIARQLRLRDLAGLIVIDFIDMDEKRNNRAVERRLKDCLKNDRARIQVGRISHFGLLEMSRQRIRTSMLESSTDKCPHCGGTGHVRSVSSVVLQLLRMIEETLQRGATHNIVGRTRSEIALYVLNHKRAHLHDLEHRFQIAITIASDDAISGQLPFVIEKGEQVRTLEQARALALQPTAIPIAIDDSKEIEAPIEEIEFEEGEEEIVDAEAAESAEPAEAAEGRAEDGEGGGRRRRRRRRRGRRSDAREEGLPMAGALEGEAAPHLSRDQLPPDAPAAEEESIPAEEAGSAEIEADLGEEELEAAGVVPADHANGDGRRRRRRGRRGGRRNRREESDLGIAPPENGVAPIDEEIAHAVEDFGGSPVEQVRDELPHEPEQLAAEHADRQRGEAATPEPAPAKPSEPVAPPKPELPRRRSTVREPVPFLVGGAAPAPQPSPAPELVTSAGSVEPAASPQPERAAGGSVAEVEPAEPPAPAQPPAEAPAPPRRAGWWAKRMLGDRR
jgi:ribonuclease E